MSYCLQDMSLMRWRPLTAWIGNLEGRGKPPALAEKPLLLTVPEAARLLGISRNLAHDLVAQGRLPHIRLGRRILIPRFGLEQWIAREADPLQPQPPVVSSLPQRH